MLKAMSLEKFTEAVASTEPVPGGGSVCALAGALAGALSAMVAALTLNKARYVDRKSVMKDLVKRAHRLQGELLAAVDADADSYCKVLAAFRLPKSTDQEKQQRTDAVQAAFRQATEVPLQVAQTALEVLELAATAVLQGNPDMVTDAGVGVLLARSAALGALMNAEFNLDSLKDQELVDHLQAKIKTLRVAVIRKETEILGTL